MSDKNTILALIETNLPDNNAQEITPAKHRAVSQQITNANLNLDELTTQTVKGPIVFENTVAGNFGINNRRNINSFADFPEPMLPDIQYYIGDQVTMPDTLPASWSDLPNNIEFKGSPVSSRLTYNGTGDLFAGENMGQLLINGLIIDAPNATIFNLSDTAGSTIVNTRYFTVTSCASVGTVNVFAFVNTNANFLQSAQGIVTGPKTLVLSISRMTVNSTSATFKAIDLSLSTISTLEITDFRSNAPAGAVFINALADSVNIVPNQIGTVHSCELSGGITPFSGGIEEHDFRYDFKTVTGARPTNPDAHMYLYNNTTETVITASSTDGSNAVKVAGAWVLKGASQFSTTAGGKISALFESDIPCPISIRNTIEPASGANKKLAVYVAVDGVVQLPSIADAEIDSGSPQSLTVIWQEVMNSAGPASYVELFAENQTDSTNILVSRSNMRLR